MKGNIKILLLQILVLLQNYKENWQEECKEVLNILHVSWKLYDHASFVLFWSNLFYLKHLNGILAFTFLGFKERRICTYYLRTRNHNN